MGGQLYPESRINSKRIYLSWSKVWHIHSSVPHEYLKRLQLKRNARVVTRGVPAIFQLLAPGKSHWPITAHCLTKIA